MWASFAADFKAIKAPKKYAALPPRHGQADLAAYQSFLHGASVAISPKMKRAAFNAKIDELVKTAGADREAHRPPLRRREPAALRQAVLDRT